MTPRYPAAMMKYFAAAVFVLLALWSAVLWNASETWGRGAGVLALGAAYIAFAATTLILQRQRRRRQSDVTLDFWKTGMACLIAACAAWALCLAAPEEHRNAVEVLAGLLALPGFAGSIISGMLYKIVPFLAWFHLQSRPGARGSVPNMKEMLGEPRQRLQFRIHMAALALLVAAVAWPGVLAYPAALALGASAILLEVNLLKVVGVLRRTRNARNALPAARR